MSAVDRILMLMEKNSVTATQLTKDMLLSTGLITQWKQQKQKPSADAIVKIALYFKVSADYILRLTDVPRKNEISKISESEEDLLSKYNALSDVAKGRLIERAQILY